MPTIPTPVPLQPVPANAVRSISGLPLMREYKARFPKRALGALSDATRTFKRWAEAVPAPTAVRNPEISVKAVRGTRARYLSLRAIADSPVAPTEMIMNQKMDAGTLFGTLFTALASYEFMKLEAEYRRRRATLIGVAATQKRWQEIVGTFQLAFASAGLRGLSERDLRTFASELSANKANLDAVVRISNSGIALASSNISGATKLTASFVPTEAKLIDASIIRTAIPDLCQAPIKQGSFTKHFSHSVSLSVRIKYPCGISWRGIKWCTKKVTLAGVSFSVGVNVGYKITCCGATAWGQGYAQACATIVGITVCAGCSATITGVAGISRTPVTSGCSYGLGISATLKCTLAGQTILNISVPFGWTVTGPCPPAGMCP